jgi:hypothetical protein
MSNEINIWLKNWGHYHEGVQLLQKYNPLHPMAEKLRKEKGKFFSEEKLTKLRAILSETIASLAIEPEPSQTTVIQSHEPAHLVPGIELKQVIQAESEEIMLLKIRAKNLHKEYSLLHAQLSTAPTDKERFRIAAAIMDRIIPELDGYYDQMRVYQQTGELTIDPGLAPKTEVIAKYQHRQNLLTRLSKLKPLIQNAKSIEERAKYEAERDTKLKEIATLNEYLGL